MNAVAGRRSAAQGNISFSIDTIIVPNGLCESSLHSPLSARRAGWTDVRRCLRALCRRRE